MRPHRVAVLLLTVVALLALPSPAAADAADYWVKDTSGAKVGIVRETGPTIDDWSYVFDGNGREIASAAGHYALRLDALLVFLSFDDIIWQADGEELYGFNQRLVGYEVERDGKWALFENTSSGAKLRGFVQGGLPAPHPLMALALLQGGFPCAAGAPAGAKKLTSAVTLPTRQRSRTTFTLRTASGSRVTAYATSSTKYYESFNLDDYRHATRASALAAFRHGYAVKARFTYKRLTFAGKTYKVLQRLFYDVVGE